jgi:hypothetical protein
LAFLFVFVLRPPISLTDIDFPFSHMLNTLFQKARLNEWWSDSGERWLPRRAFDTMQPSVASLADGSQMDFEVDHYPNP